MTFNTLQSSFLPRQLNIPKDNPKELPVVLDKMYIDIAGRVNDRTIGIYAVNQVITIGDAYYLTGQPNKQQALRKTFTFTSTTPFNHGINLSQITYFVKIYGTFTDGTNWYPLPYVDAVSATNQVALKVTPTQVVITAGAGAPPAITKGIVVLEWIVTT